ncbi:hypothetical protein SDC9_180015 [bioreactor metagenome]|uniref:Uncharacterized protein n=1 Tax=bioreactor metagenome TaxID=1076179 RepID=A0A645H231_9ZZZZ
MIKRDVRLSRKRILRLCAIRSGCISLCRIKREGMCDDRNRCAIIHRVLFANADVLRDGQDAVGQRVRTVDVEIAVQYGVVRGGQRCFVKDRRDTVPADIERVNRRIARNGIGDVTHQCVNTQLAAGFYTKAFHKLPHVFVGGKQICVPNQLIAVVKHLCNLRANVPEPTPVFL